MTTRSPQLRLHDILEAAAVLENKVMEYGLENLRRDIEKRYVMERALEVISEASRHIPIEWKEANPHIKWQRMADLGNRLRHGYDRVDVTLLWELVENDVPVLVLALMAYRVQ